MRKHPQLVSFMERHPACVVAMEACGSAHHWGRMLARMGHEVRLVPPAYVKPFVKRHKNDAADAEAIVEAALRPTMRFVAVKAEEQQALAMAYRCRDMLVRQRTQLVNALRGHLAEFGIVAPAGLSHLNRLATHVEDTGNGLPELVRELARMQLERIADLTVTIDEQERHLRRVAAATNAITIQTIPGVGPITAAAMEAFAPPLETFRRGRDFAAWLGLVPRQYSTGGKERLGRISKMGQRDIRRLLVNGAMAVIRWAIRKETDADPWIRRLLARKPKMVAAIALANKMARIVWAIGTTGTIYHGPQPA